ncbi:hypothetical protein PVAP13_4KG034800 [Panicum virgatum]|uniref:Uncharacterized protein n=1 Tax=Panicum virgatum TaxID=38727 RepID=A0A8T0TC42_PANVG|nr:hypothetical protein PVAP13_4KG034800 [Panicum virgatum]
MSSIMRCSYEITLLQPQLSIMDMILTLVLNSVQLVDLSIFLYLCEVGGQIQPGDLRQLQFI